MKSGFKSRNQSQPQSRLPSQPQSRLPSQPQSRLQSRTQSRTQSRHQWSHSQTAYEETADDLEGTKPENGEKTDHPQAESINPDVLFQDGIRKIDFVLVYEKKQESRNDVVDNIHTLIGNYETEDVPMAKATYCQTFLNNIEKAGLEIEEQDHMYLHNHVFVKVHIPWESLLRYAEIFKLKMPIAENDMIDKTNFWPYCTRLQEYVHYKAEELPHIDHFFTSVFSEEHMDSFIISKEEQGKYFSDAQRSLLVYFVLSMTKYDTHKLGIDGLLSSGVFVAAYPLHSGEVKDYSKQNLRGLLYRTWAKFYNWHRTQPIDHIRLYFGEKIALYFRWLGFYTRTLLPMAILGLLTFIVCITDAATSEMEICDKNIANVIMCPICDKYCKFYTLYTACDDDGRAQVLAIFDSIWGVVFAAIMTVWTVVFLEFWKRIQADLQFRWHVHDFKEFERVRPEFENLNLEQRISPVSGKMEPYLNYKDKAQTIAVSVVTVITFICVIVFCLVGVIIYTTAVSQGFNENHVPELLEGYEETIVNITASLINLIFIFILSWVYQCVAFQLTNYEKPRTQSEWENSYITKMFLFQFVNYNSHLLYIALFKGKIVGFPKEYLRIFGFRCKECGPGGCLAELCTALIVTFVGKQALNNIQELIMPYVCKWIRKFWLRSKITDNIKKMKLGQMEKDFELQEWTHYALIDEYLEMILQYVYMTMYIAAFPLAPLFAYLNNMIEIRIDAFKIVTQYQRPIARRAQDIGIWYSILKTASMLSILFNAIIIAFTTDFIPRQVYNHLVRNPKYTDHYLQFKLSKINVTDIEQRAQPQEKTLEGQTKIVEMCYYFGYRHPPDYTAGEPYSLTTEYWQVMAARVFFVFGFCLFLILTVQFIRVAIPDVRYTTLIQIMREKHLANEARINAMAKRYNKQSEAIDLEIMSTSID